MKYVFIGFGDNWADEMDIEINTAVKMSEEDFDELFKKIDTVKRKHRTEAWFGVGSNEGIEYQTGADFIDMLDVREMTEDEYKVFEKFGLTDGQRSLFYNLDYLYEECKDLEDAVDYDDEEEGY